MGWEGGRTLNKDVGLSWCNRSSRDFCTSFTRDGDREREIIGKRSIPSPTTALVDSHGSASYLHNRLLPSLPFRKTWGGGLCVSSAGRRLPPPLPLPWKGRAMTTIFAPMSLAAILLPIRGPGLTDANPGRFAGRSAVQCGVTERERESGYVGAQLEAWSLGLGAIDPLGEEAALQGRRGTVTRCRKKETKSTIPPQAGFMTGRLGKGFSPPSDGRAGSRVWLRR
ncbi:hypothetical protein LZ31DRAFT_61251 [Colletotrichum somersetense]|nr:hypothetical protein LZ31DRAFT_61251 [Colletotrichum somersetense]